MRAIEQSGATLGALGIEASTSGPKLGPADPSHRLEIGYSSPGGPGAPR